MRSCGRRCVDQIFTLKQIGEEAREKKCRMYACDRVNRKVFWQMLRMYYVSGKLWNKSRSMYGRNKRE